MMDAFRLLISVVLVVLISHLFTVPAGAQPCTDYGATTRLISRFDTPGNATATATQGSRLYVADGDRLSVFHVPSNDVPVLLGELPLSGTNYLVVDEPFVYLTHANGVFIVDVSVPAVRGSVTTAVTAHRLDLEGDNLFVADGSDGLLVIDVSDPDLPVVIGTAAPSGQTTSVSVDGTIAGIIHNDGLSIYDVSDPTQPVELSSPFLEYPGADVYVDGGTVYATCRFLDPVNGWEGYLEVFDVSNPSAPVRIGAVFIAQATEFTVAADLAFVNAGDQLVTVDVSDPASPTRLSTLIETGGREIAVAGDRAYVAHGDVSILDLSQSSSPGATGPSVYSSAEDRDIHIEGQYLYAAATGYGSVSGVEVYALNGPVLTQVGFVHLSYDCLALTVEDGWAFVSAVERDIYGAPGLYTVDVSVPGNPTVTAFIGDSFIDADAEGGILYTVHEAQGLQAYEIDQSGALTLLGTAHSGFLYAVEVRGEHALVGGSSGFEVYDVSDPTTPTLLGGVPTSSWVADVTVDGDLAYVVDSSMLMIVDVTDPTDPSLISTTDTYLSSIDEVEVANGIAYVTQGCGFRVFDVSDPWNVALLGSGATGAGLGGLEVQDDVLYFASTHVEFWDWPWSTGWTRIYGLPVQCPVTAAVGSAVAGVPALRAVAAPNPFNSTTRIRFTLSRSAPARVGVYDVSGRLRRRLVDRVLPSGDHAVAWDGRDARGWSVAAGIYFLRVETDRQAAVQRVVRVR